MKKQICIILASVCLVGLVGCGAKNNVNTNTTNNTNKSVEQKSNTNQNAAADTSKSEEQEKDNKEEEASTSPIIGVWSNVQNASEMELTEDGKLLDAGNEVATYELVGEDTVKIHNNSGEEVELKYEIDGDNLKWATNYDPCQEFTRKNNSDDTESK